MEGSPLSKLLAIASKRVLDLAQLQGSELADREYWAQLEARATAAEVPEELLDEANFSGTNSISVLISQMSFPEKVKLALLGNSVARTLLIRDANRQVGLLVLDNPKLTENEVVEFAKNQNLDESILREIAKSPNWTKSYSIKLALVGNAKTPVDVSLNWLKHLKPKDLRQLSRSKNIASVVSQQSKKLLDLRSRKQSDG